MFYGSDEFNSAIENTHGNAPKTRLKFADDEILDLVSSIRYYGGSNDSDDVSIGTTTMARVEVSAYTDKLLANREFLLEQGIELANGVVEYMPIGYFTIQKPSGDIDQVTFTAYDRMQKFEKPYSSSLAYPTTSILILDELCQICGIELATTLDNAIEVTENLKGYTCREVLGYIASMHSSFACIDRYGRLNLRWYSDTPIEKSLKKIWHFEKSQDNFEIAKVEIAKDSETNYVSGSGITTLHNSNPLATQEITDDIFAKLGGFSYSVGEIEMLDDARLDPWDMVSVEYYDGKTYNIPCMTLEHDFKAYSTTVKSVGKSESENEYRFTGPTIQYLNRMAADLLVANRVIATKVDAEYVNSVAITTENFDAKVAEIKELIVEEIDGKYANIDLANIDIANINVGKIGELFAKVGLIDRATIVEGHITGFLDAVEINANKITAGTLVADRILLSGGKEGVLYALNNLGELTSTNVDTLDGYVLTDRTINADKLIANSITANELDVNQIFGNEAVLNKLVSQEIFSDAVATNTVVVGVSKDAKDALDLANSTNTASGSPILLTDSADGTLIDFRAYGRSTQNGTPTPDSPVAIKSVADGGYFDGELLQGYYATDGSVTSYAGRVSAKNLIPCNEGDNIKLTYEESASTLNILYFKDNVWLSQTTGNDVSELSGTVPSGANSFGININKEGITPQTAKHITVTINGKYALIVKSKGKNLLDVSNCIGLSGSEKFTLEGNTITIASGSNVYGVMFSNDYVGLKKGGTYSFSSKVISGTITNEYRLRYSDGTYSNNISTNTTVTIAKEVSYILFYLGRPYTGSTDVVISDLQIEENTEVTDYEPYKETVSYIPLSEPLRSSLDGTVTDEVSLTEVTRRFAEVVFDGSDDEGWVFASNDNFGYIPLTNSVNPKSNDLLPNLLCSHFTLVVRNLIENGKCGLSTGGNFIVQEFSKFTNLDELKAWLQANPITVIYELAEPITETIEPVDLVTYDNVTYISNADNAEMEVKYYRNTPTGIQLAKLADIEQDNSRLIANWASDNDVTLIDGAKIYTGSITADKINVDDLFAQEITATGTITGATLVSYSEDSTQKVVIKDGMVELYSLDTRGEGGYQQTGAIYPAGVAQTGASGLWIFDGVETISGNDLDTVASQIPKVVNVKYTLSSINWIKSYNGMYYAYLETGGYGVNTALAITTGNWTALRATDVVTFGLSSGGRIIINANTNSFINDAFIEARILCT